MQLHYEALSEEVRAKIESDRRNGVKNPYAFIEEEKAVHRRNQDRDKANIIRTAFVRDCDKIINCPYYNRYADKTQVFSFMKNDDISRRSLHVQLVSRTARTIGKALNLNLDLIEAIALGHDIGHTPFGHAGERILDELYCNHVGRHFAHNIQSVRVLDKIYPYNITLETLSGIAGHNGEIELLEYAPKPQTSFAEFDKEIEACYHDPANILKLVPNTLEGCVVRISDIIAYLGKDRQDAERAKIITESDFNDSVIGTRNAELINNLVVNIIENSYGKPYIKLDEEHFEALKVAKQENYETIYFNPASHAKFDSTIKPMMEEMYERLLKDLAARKKDSPILKHHIRYVKGAHYERKMPYEMTEPNQIVVDYIASMTDDYFLDLYKHLFPSSKLKVEYREYFK